ncbi:hypothetical protein BJX99DRAFT_259692 [Aspergillus californicus]
MRVLLLTLVMAFFSTITSAHDVRCAGKAIAAPFDPITDALYYLERVQKGEMWTPAGHPVPPKIRNLGPNSCEQVVCMKGAQVRWCNDDTKNSRSMPVENIRQGAAVLYNECQQNYKGKRVAGGQLTHPDNWSVVVQGVDECKFPEMPYKV